MFLSEFPFKAKKKQTYISCEYLENSLIFDYQNNIKFCPFSHFGIIKKDYDGIWLDTEEIKKSRRDFVNQLNGENPPAPCKNCEYKNIFCKEKQDYVIKKLYLANWKSCYINCCYCDFPKEEDLIKAHHYDIFPAIRQLLDLKLIGKKTKVIFECGDASIHPEFDKIMYFFINYGMKDIVINTPALRYCESIAEAIGKNIAQAVISFDSGCPYIYEKIKGTNKFDIVVDNLKQYLSFEEHSQKRVILKYTILSGINDNKKEILDWFMAARDFGVKKLALDIDIKWYNQIKNNPPYYLKELVLFAKRISDYNCIETEFYERAQRVYKSIQKGEIKD